MLTARSSVNINTLFYLNLAQLFANGKDKKEMVFTKGTD